MSRMCPHFLWCLAAPQAAYIPLLLMEVVHDRRPKGNGDCEATEQGAGFCDGEGDCVNTAFGRFARCLRYQFRKSVCRKMFDSWAFFGSLIFDILTSIRWSIHSHTCMCSTNSERQRWFRGNWSQKILVVGTSFHLSNSTISGGSF